MKTSPIWLIIMCDKHRPLFEHDLIELPKKAEKSSVKFVISYEGFSFEVHMLNISLKKTVYWSLLNELLVELMNSKYGTNFTEVTPLLINDIFKLFVYVRANGVTT